MAELHSDTRTNKSDDERSNTENSSSESLDEVNIPAKRKEIQLDSLCKQLLPELSTQPADLLAIALFLLFTESGFIPLYGEPTSEENEKLQQNLQILNHYKLPSDWNTIRPGSYTFRFGLPNCPEYLCRLVAVPLGDLLLINAVSTEPVAAFSVCLDINRYISENSGCSGLTLTKSKELSFKFKDAVVSPTRSTALSFRGIPSASLTGLPKELLLKIMILSGPEAVCRLACVSHYMSIMARDQYVWHRFYVESFPKTVINYCALQNIDWYTEFKDKYKDKLTMRRQTPFQTNNYPHYFDVDYLIFN